MKLLYIALFLWIATAGSGPVADTVFVAPPTGDREADRASIQAALNEVESGDTVRFAPGMYKIGPMIRVEIPDITLLGHPEGTVIRGCDPDEFPEHEKALFKCHGFELTAARQTVRNLTFEFTWHGLFVGCCFPKSPEELEAGKAPPRSQPGGHLIEGNTFRYAPNGLRVIGEGTEPTVVRNNRFIDVYHAIGINGGPVHFLDNEMSVKHPEWVPNSHHPGDVINLSPSSGLSPTPGEDHTSCRNNLIARNRIDGYPDGIRIIVFTPNSSCRDNVIRDNTITVRRIPFPENWQGIRMGSESDSTVVGIPLRLSNLVEADSSRGHSAGNAVIENNLIEGNRVIGAEGLGMEILHATGNRIVNNTFSGIQKRNPFPGNTLGGDPSRWQKANGSGIWLSSGSNGNEIAGNSFEKIEGVALYLEGDSNRVVLRSAEDTVRDMGSDNRVILPNENSNFYQDTELPRTRTFPGIENPAFPYARPEEVGVSSEKLNRLGEEITSWVANGELVGGELLIIKDGKAVFHEAYGWSDREKQQPMGRNSIFYLDGLTKPFTAAAVLMLAEEGRLSLDDPVRKYISTYPDEITTIHHLLTQTSGFNWIRKSKHGDASKVDSRNDWVEALATDKRLRSRGNFKQSDYNYVFLGHIVQAVTGKTIEEFVDEKILHPLELDNTYTTYSPDAGWKDKLNSRYRWVNSDNDYDKYWLPGDRRLRPFYPGANNIYSSTMDFAKFMWSWMKKGAWNDTRILQELTVEQSLKVKAPINNYGYGFGYGWYIWNYSEEPMPDRFHHGAAPGSFAVGFPFNDAMVIYFTQSSGSLHLPALTNRIGMMEIFDHPGPYTWNLVPPKDHKVEEINLSAEELNRFVGTYRVTEPDIKNRNGRVVRVWTDKDGERLLIREGNPDQSAVIHQHLVPLGNHLFAVGRYRGDRLEAIDPSVKIRFTMEDGKAIAAEALSGGEIEFSARRIEK